MWCVCVMSIPAMGRARTYKLEVKMSTLKHSTLEVPTYTHLAPPITSTPNPVVKASSCPTDKSKAEPRVNHEIFLSLVRGGAIKCTSGPWTKLSHRPAVMHVYM